MRLTFSLLGWTGTDVRVGVLRPDGAAWTVVALDWSPSDIRNCSHAAAADLVGISAQDRDSGSYRIAVHRRGTGERTACRDLPYVLHHALDRGGARVAYTRPGERSGAIDLVVDELAPASGGSARLLLSSASPTSAPAWEPDGRHVVLEDQAGRILRVGVGGEPSTVLGNGRAPAVHPAGGRVAMIGGEGILVVGVDGGTIRCTVPIARRRRSRLVDLLSWSPDGRWLIVGWRRQTFEKQTVFAAVTVEAPHRWHTVPDAPHRGTIIVATQEATR